MNPNLAKEWHPTKNENLGPQDVLPNSGKSVWWQCSLGHEWRARISDRNIRQTKCTQCKGFAVRHQDEIYTKDGKKICKKCRKPLDLSAYRRRLDSRDGQVRYNNICKTCDVKSTVEYRASKKGIAAEIVRRKKSLCLKKNLPFDLDVDWVFDKLNSVQWKCELTGMEFNLKNMLQDRKGFAWDSLSVDRKDPKGGYTKSNVRFILNMVNVFRQDQSDSTMYAVAEALIKTRKRERL
jgi:RNase P subunit RPR2